MKIRLGFVQHGVWLIAYIAERSALATTGFGPFGGRKLSPIRENRDLKHCTPLQNILPRMQARLYPELLTVLERFADSNTRVLSHCGLM